MLDTNRSPLPDMSDALRQVQQFDEKRKEEILLEKKTDKPKRWQDDDGDGKWYEKTDVDGKISKREKKSKSHDCASKVKHEEYGVGECMKEMHDLDENGNVAHYDVLFSHGIEKNVPVENLEVVKEGMHEHVIHDQDEVITDA